MIEGSDRKIPERAAWSKFRALEGRCAPVTSGDARAATWAVLVPSQAAGKA